MKFKDISIESFFKYQEENYKKIDFEHAKNIERKTIYKFFLDTDIEVDKNSKFKLNY